MELFDRTHRSAYLTEAGRLFYYDAIQLIKQYKIALNHINDYKKSTDKIIKIGTLPFQAQYNLNSMFKNFEKLNPEIYINVDEVEEEELLNGINHNKYDFIIARENILNSREYSSYTICEDELVVVLPTNHRLANNTTLNLTQLSNENFILMNPYTSIYKLCINELKKIIFLIIF